MLVSNQGYKDNIDYTTAQETLNILSNKNLDLGKSEVISSSSKKDKDDSIERKLFSFKKIFNELQYRLNFFYETTLNQNINRVDKEPFGFVKVSYIIEAYKNFVDYFKTNILKTYLTTSNQVFKDEVVNIFGSLNSSLNRLRQSLILSAQRLNDLGKVPTESARQTYTLTDNIYNQLLSQTNEIISILNNNNLKRLSVVPQELESVLDSIIFNIVK